MWAPFSRARSCSSDSALLEGRGRPGDKLLEEFFAETVEPDVAEGGRRSGRLLIIGEGTAGKIERVPGCGADDFYDVRIGEVCFIGDGVGSSDHREGSVALERGGERIDERRVDEGFVALNINDDFGGTPERSCGFGDAVRAGRVVGAGHYDVRAEGFGGFRDADVVGGDGEVIEPVAAAAALPDVLDERLARDRVERLPRKPG